MTNRFDFGSMPVRGGFVAFYRMVHHSSNFILRDGKHDIIFATADEAEREAGKAFKEYLNSPISGMTAADDDNFDKANGLFNLEPTARPANVRQRGSNRRTEVERRERA
jgi:hypothetical protein